MNEERKAVDKAVRALWVELHNLSTYGLDAITDEDLDLWGKVTAHSAVQDRLNDKALQRPSADDIAGD